MLAPTREHWRWVFCSDFAHWMELGLHRDKHWHCEWQSCRCTGRGCTVTSPLPYLQLLSLLPSCCLAPSQPATPSLHAYLSIPVAPSLLYSRDICPACSSSTLDASQLILCIFWVLRHTSREGLCGDIGFAAELVTSQALGNAASIAPMGDASAQLPALPCSEGSSSDWRKPKPSPALAAGSEAPGFALQVDESR